MHQVDEEARYCKQSVQRSFNVTGIPDENFSDWICALNLKIVVVSFKKVGGVTRRRRRR
jgi:hypothetical protein